MNGATMHDVEAEERRAIKLADLPDLGFTLTSAADIFAPLAEPDYLVDGAFRRGSLILLGAYGASSKTWLALALVLSVASGRKWLDRFDCKEGAATVLDWESGDYELRRRMQLIARGMKLENVAGVDFASMPAAYMGTDDFVKRVRKLATHRALVVIDSLRAASPGAEENDSSMRRGLDQLRATAEKTGCVFLVIVHAKKTGNAPIKPDPREALRGSSAIFDAADTVLVVTAAKGKPLRVEQVKSRHGKAIDPFEVTITDTALGTGVVLVASDLDEADDTTPDAKFTAACDRVLRVVRENPGISARQLREKAGIKSQTTTAAVEHLVDTGKIANVGDKARAAYRPTGEA